MAAGNHGCEDLEKNIFLHFLNRDARDIYGMTRLMGPSQEAERIGKALTVAVLLCKDFCVTPPTFILEDQVIAGILLRSKPYFENEVIRISMRESDPEEFIEKKKREYRSHPAAATRATVEKMLLRP